MTCLSGSCRIVMSTEKLDSRAGIMPTLISCFSAQMIKQRPSAMVSLMLFSMIMGGCGGSNSPGAGPDGGNDTNDGNPSVDNSSLIHEGKPLPVNNVNPQTTSFYSAVGRDKLAALDENPAVVYEVIDNHGGDAFAQSADSCSTLGAQYSSCSVTNLHVKDATGSLNSGNWKLYFHSIRRILRVDSDEFSVSFVNGDLNYLEPTANFTGFNGDEVKTLVLITEFNHLIESDFMPRYWLVDGDGNVRIIRNTDSDTDESPYSVAITGDNARAFDDEPIDLATAASRFRKNTSIANQTATQINAIELQSRIIPKPRDMLLQQGALDISGGFSFASSDLSSGSKSALQSRQAQFMNTAGSVPLTGTINTALGVDTHSVVVNASGITLQGSDNEALFNAAQSVLGLVRPGTGTIPFISITDTPRFNYRGMHIDVARNFHSLNSVKRLLDQMAAYKLNRLHMHLSDDEGWRLEIPSLPELTGIGAKRQFQVDAQGRVSEVSALMPQLGSGPDKDNQGSGHYTSAQFVELLRYAADRHITVIPEFDMPAHARAAVVAMRARAANLGSANDINIRLDDPADTSRYLTIQHYDDGILNPCIPGTYNFINTVITDVKAMYVQADATLDVWHMGGDEANNVFTGDGFQDINEPNKVPWRGEIDRSAWDFPWQASPACTTFIQNTAGINSREDLQPYFIKQVAQAVADAGLSTLFAYQDIYDNLNASELATQSAGVAYWQPVFRDNGHENINGFSNRGFQTLITVPDFLYFDFPQEVDPEERGYYWASRYTDTRKVFGFAPENLPQNAETSVTNEGRDWSATGIDTNQGFIGMQGQLWSETVRTQDQLEYMIFPRLLALAERAWHKADWELDYQPGVTFEGGVTNLVDKALRNQDYAEFASALAYKELAKLDAASIHYRIPVPGAINDAGNLLMNTDLPGLPLEYSGDGISYSRYSGAVPAGNVRFIRARSATGTRAGRADAFP